MISDEIELKSLLETDIKDEVYLKEGINKLQEKIKENPDDLELRYYIGILYSRNLDFKNAIDNFEYILNSQYSFIYVNHVRTMLGMIYTRISEYDKAKEYVEKVLDYDENNLTAKLILGYTYYGSEQYDKALELYNEILGIEESNVTALNGTGYIYIVKGEQIEKGIEYCKKALELQPKNPAILDSIGWGYFKLENESTAIEYLREAFELAPDNKEIKIHLKQILNF